MFNLMEKCSKCNGGLRSAYSIHGRRMGETECPYCGGSGRRLSGTKDAEKERHHARQKNKQGSGK